MIRRVLVAGRGVAACRVMNRLRAVGIETVAVHSESDRSASHVLLAQQSLCIGNAPGVGSYRKAGVILDAARVSHADAIYVPDGALGHNADFAEAVEAQGLHFMGPLHGMMRALESPITLKRLAFGQGLPKFVALERLINPGQRRRLDFHFFGDGTGGAVALGETQRLRLNGEGTLVRSEFVEDDEELIAVRRAIVSMAGSIRYRTAGSITLVFEAQGGQVAIESVRAGLPDTFAAIEELLGIDLVEWTLRTLEGSPMGAPEVRPNKRCVLAVPVAVTASADALASAGIITQLTLSEASRTDVAVEVGAEISQDSDPHLLTLVTSGDSRDRALENLFRALESTKIRGVTTNVETLRNAVGTLSRIHKGEAKLGLRLPTAPRHGFEVVRSGTFTIVVDFPGRTGYWPVGIPPSGPMDDLSHRFANRIVGNVENAATLEMTLNGPTLRFESDAVVAFVGASMPAFLDERAAVAEEPIAIKAGQVLRFGSLGSVGARTYLAIRGGIDVAPYLNSATTFTLGGFGGHNGRALRKGDFLSVGQACSSQGIQRPKTRNLVELTNHWRIGVLYGPHAAPEFFTDNDIAALFQSEYEVHYNSNRTGVRLIGPKPEWARADGGEAGLHPSNIHDVPYAIGAIDFTGDMPILLGPDGPSLGGFVCPATVAAAELWKLGQLRPGDKVRFVPISDERASEQQDVQRVAIRDLLPAAGRSALVATRPTRAILAEAASAGELPVTYRRSGDKRLLVEYGPMALDLRLRFRVHALMQWLKMRELPGIIELTPGIRSLQVHFDNDKMTRHQLLDELLRAEGELPDISSLEVPSRIVHLPLSWDDPQTRRAIQIYGQSVRADAPWCPSNIEFIRRINGLKDEREVYDIVFAASYLVLGLGDVYLGAPVATPLDPRHRLVTTKYNPARTWTPENAVGIGGAYLCIYGMEGPGGYQFVGRTIQVYNRYRRTPRFAEGQPWLLRFFDQLRFYPVSAEQLLDHRRDFLVGKFDIAIEETRFRLSEYQRFLADNTVSIGQFKAKQQAAFEAERKRWFENGQLGASASVRGVDPGYDSNPQPTVVECAP